MIIRYAGLLHAVLVITQYADYYTVTITRWLLDSAKKRKGLKSVIFVRKGVVLYVVGVQWSSRPVGSRYWDTIPGNGSSKVIKWKGYGTGYSQAVTHPSTNPACSCLTSEIERDRVHSTEYGRIRQQSNRATLIQTQSKWAAREIPVKFDYLSPTTRARF